MNARPMMMFHTGECGCSQSGYATPVCAPSGALISDPRYLGLTTANTVQVLGVPSGSNTQAFLKAANGVSGFLTYTGGNVTVDVDPALTLPIINAPVSGSYPATGSFSAFTVGSGSSSSLDWRHFFAPTSGKYTIVSENGTFHLEDFATIPGLEEIATSGTTALRGQILVTVEPTPGNFAIRKLRSQENKLIAGFVDGTTGETGYTMISDADFVQHPHARFRELQSFTYQATNSSGDPISGGLPALVTTGSGAVTDAISVYYSGTTKQFYFAPASTTYFLNDSTNSGLQTVPTSYAAMPAGHGQGASRVFNFPTVQITFFAGLGGTAANNTQSFAIYKDGALLEEFDNDNRLSVAITYVDQNVTLGSHTYDVRWKRTSGTDTVAIRNSNFLVRSLS